MKREQDAYGQMMLDYLRTGGGFEIVEHEDGDFSIGAGPRLYFAEFDSWRQTERDAMAYVKGRVLDTVCGAGRFMLWLREKVTRSSVSTSTSRLARSRSVRRVDSATYT